MTALSLPTGGDGIMATSPTKLQKSDSIGAIPDPVVELFGNHDSISIASEVRPGSHFRRVIFLPDERKPAGANPVEISFTQRSYQRFCQRAR